MNAITRLSLALLLTLVSTRHAFLETRPQDQQAHATRDSSDRITLDVLVRHGKAGNVVIGLDKQSFSVYEGDVRQEIEEFRPGGSASIVLLLDLSGSMTRVAGNIREGAKSAWRHFASDSEVAIMTFAQNVELIQEFTRDKQLLADRIEKTYASTAGAFKGQTNLENAVHQAASYLGNSSGSQNHRFILVISDGQSNQQQGHSKKQVLQALFASRATLYCLVATDSHINKPPGGYALVDYAAETGGLSAIVDNFDFPYIHRVELGEKLVLLIALLQNRYLITYRPSNSKLDGKYRKINVKISGDVQRRLGKVSVVTRRGYHPQ